MPRSFARAAPARRVAFSEGTGIRREPPRGRLVTNPREKCATKAHEPISPESGHIKRRRSAPVPEFLKRITSPMHLLCSHRDETRTEIDCGRTEIVRVLDSGVVSGVRHLPKRKREQLGCVESAFVTDCRAWARYLRPVITRPSAGGHKTSQSLDSRRTQHLTKCRTPRFARRRMARLRFSRSIRTIFTARMSIPSCCSRIGRPPAGTALAIQPARALRVLPPPLPEAATPAGRASQTARLGGGQHRGNLLLLPAAPPQPKHRRSTNLIERSRHFASNAPPNRHAVAGLDTSTYAFGLKAWSPSARSLLTPRRARARRPTPTRPSPRHPPAPRSPR